MTVSLSISYELITDLDSNLDASRTAIARGIDVIHNEFANLFSTRVGEVEFEPTLGSMIMYRVFDPADDITKEGLLLDIYTASRTWMSARAELTVDNIAVEVPDFRTITITLDYTLISFDVQVRSVIEVKK